MVFGRTEELLTVSGEELNALLGAVSESGDVDFGLLRWFAAPAYVVDKHLQPKKEVDDLPLGDLRQPKGLLKTTGLIREPGH